MTVLYLTEPGSSLHVQSRALVVRKAGALLGRMPLLGTERVMVQSPAMLSSTALARCAEGGVEVVVGGRGALARMGCSPAGLALRGAQLRRAADEAWCLEFARGVVRGKVHNQRRLLARSRAAAQPEVAAARAEMDALLGRIAAAQGVPALRGLEGRASAVYFRAFRTLLNPEYGFRGRNRRPPRDAANALLSFAYTLLSAEATAAVAATGLEPALGFFHRARGGRPALALDLVEELRAPAADSAVLQAAGRRIVRPADFTARPDGGVRMRRGARRRFLGAWERRLCAPFRTRDGQEATLRGVLREQAKRLAHAVLTEEAYAPFQLP